MLFVNLQGNRGASAVGGWTEASWKDIPPCVFLEDHPEQLSSFHLARIYLQTDTSTKMDDSLSRPKARISRLPSKPPTPSSGPGLFQFMSDLHLELGQQYASFDFPATAPYLILGGDIGRLADYGAYLKFLSRQTARYERVFLVLGNHEFHGMGFHSAVSAARKLEGEDVLGGKLCLLHRDREELLDGKVTVLGCPLWSRIPDESADLVRSRVKDFQKITDWSVQRHNEAHAVDLQWLRGEVNALSHEAGKVVVVVTHHAPSVQETSRPEQVDGPQTCAFATDLLSEGGWGPVDYWMYGHTHYANDFERDGVKVISNQRGYVLSGMDMSVGGKMNPGKQAFDAGKAIRIAIE